MAPQVRILHHLPGRKMKAFKSALAKEVLSKLKFIDYDKGLVYTTDGRVYKITYVRRAG